jgi:hypothetical protein
MSTGLTPDILDTCTSVQIYCLLRCLVRRYCQPRAWNCFVVSGVWHRTGTHADTLRWRCVSAALAAARHLVQGLLRWLSWRRLAQVPPSGYDSEHPLLPELKCKDAGALAHFTEAQTCVPDFPHVFVEIWRAFALLTNAFFDECTGIGMVGESKSRGVGTMPHTGLTPRKQRLLQTGERTAWLLS